MQYPSDAKHTNLQWRSICLKTALDDGRVINPALPNEPKIIMNPYTKEELSKKLGITVEELDKLKLPDFYEEMASKISLPLSYLYCGAKFVYGKYKIG